MTSHSDLARWIWRDDHDPHPINTFTWFRRIVHLETVPEDATLAFAADSNAQLWINGHSVRRKVSRYDEPKIRTETVDAGRWLSPGANVVVVLHHNWGPVTTFQRTTNTHAGLYLSSTWVASDNSWTWTPAVEFLAHQQQYLGVQDHTPRIRFPVVWTPSFTPDGLHDPEALLPEWSAVRHVGDGPWPARPQPVETPRQREHFRRPGSIVAAGSVSGLSHDLVPDLTRSAVTPDLQATGDATALVDGEPLVIRAAAGETRYVTVDFHRPVHGFPTLAVASTGAVDLALGYGELAYSMYDGTAHVTENGWVDTDGVVATRYGDVVKLEAGRHDLELPDERTMRWMTVHVAFAADAEVTFHSLGLVSSQYPTEPRGTFHCGDPRVDQIVSLCLIHAEVTMTDAYVDTPGREDGQWIEDARPRALISERWFGDTQLRRFMIRTLAEGQGDDGNLHPFYPSNYPAYPAQYDWSVQWAAMLVDDFRWHGDLEFVQTYFPALERYWTTVLRHVDASGVWVTDHVFADIRNSARPAPGESSGIVTPWIIDRLRSSAELAAALDRPELATEWVAIADTLTEAFRRHHLRTDHPEAPYLVTDVYNPTGSGPEARGFSQAGQAFPLLHHLLDDEQAQHVIDYAFPAPDASPPAGVLRWNNPTWSYRILRALTDHGHADRAVAHLIERYAPYLPGHPRNPTPLGLQGPFGGPLPEYWLSRDDEGLAPEQVNERQPVDVTGSHGWGAMPLLWLHDSLLGVRSSTVGGDHLTIAPNTGGLPYVSGTTLTPRGAVYVYLDPAEPVLTVDLPAGVSATLSVPEVLSERRFRHTTEGTIHSAGTSEVRLHTSGQHTFRPC